MVASWRRNNRFGTQEDLPPLQPGIISDVSSGARAIEFRESWNRNNETWRRASSNIPPLQPGITPDISEGAQPLIERERQESAALDEKLIERERQESAALELRRNNAVWDQEEISTSGPTLSRDDVPAYTNANDESGRQVIMPSLIQSGANYGAGTYGMDSTSAHGTGISLAKVDAAKEQMLNVMNMASSSENRIAIDVTVNQNGALVAALSGAKESGKFITTLKTTNQFEHMVG